MNNLYKPRDILSPIIDFVKLCPFLDDYNIDLTDMNVQKITDGLPDGSAIDYVGSKILRSQYDVVGDYYSERQANFNIWLLRKSGYDFERKDVADFIWNFEQWVEYKQAFGETPKLSNTIDGEDEEIMYADNGLFFSDFKDGEDSSIYMIQLHVIYENTYEID